MVADQCTTCTTAEGPYRLGTVAAMARTEVSPTAVRGVVGRLSWSVVPALAGAGAAAVAASGWARSRRALARTADELRAERTDGLTGVATRRVWQSIARDRVAAPDQPLWIAVIDLDDLKPVNDRLGHQAGDAVLKATARRLSTTLSASVVAGRLGGDEFGLLVESPPAGWRRLLDEQLAQPVRLDETDPASAIPVRASIGAVDVPTTGGDLSELLGAADVAMYQVKTSRRDACAPPRCGEMGWQRDSVPVPRLRGVAGPRRTVRHPTLHRKST